MLMRLPMQRTFKLPGDQYYMPRDARAIEHETAFVRSFIIRERRERWLSQLVLPKKRGRLLDRLNHRFYKDLDARFVTASIPYVLGHDSNECYVIASEDKYDGRFVSASEVADVLSVAYFGIVVSIIPGKLACYKDEAPADVIWMQRD
jgi:hypothetical protein